MIAPAFIVCLNTDRSLIGLDIAAAEQIALHHSNDRNEQLAHPYHRIVQRGERDIYAPIAA
jgi:hypothetical protein